MHASLLRSAFIALAISSTSLSFAQDDLPVPHVSGNLVTSGASLSMGQRIAVQNFKLEDFVISIVDVQWTPPTQRAGQHTVEYRWMRDGTIVSDLKKLMWFNRTPTELTTRRAAGALGAGHYTVETLMDGAIAATGEFDVAG